MRHFIGLFVLVASHQAFAGSGEVLVGSDTSVKIKPVEAPSAPKSAVGIVVNRAGDETSAT